MRPPRLSPGHPRPGSEKHARRREGRRRPRRARFLGTANEDEIADLVGQLERYAERKTGRGVGARADEPLRDTNAANRPRPNRPPSPRRGPGSAGAGASASSTAGERWGSKPASHAAGRPLGDGSRPGPEDDENSLVGPWDGVSSQYASSVQDSDALSVYSVRDSEFGLPGAPLNRYDNANVRIDSVSENLEQHRQLLEETMRQIESSSRSRGPLEFMDTDGMPTAGEDEDGGGGVRHLRQGCGGRGGEGSKPAGGKAERVAVAGAGEEGELTDGDQRGRAGTERVRSVHAEHVRVLHGAVEINIGALVAANTTTRRNHLPP